MSHPATARRTGTDRRARRHLLTCVAAAAASAALLAVPAAPAAAADNEYPERQTIIAALNLTGPEVTADPSAAPDFGRDGTTSTRNPEHSLQRALNGTGPRTHALALPLTALVPSSPYGTRTSPVTGNPSEFHTGQDFAAACGSGVLAAAAGTVTYAQWHPGGGGWRIELTHPGGLKTTYNHLSSFTVAKGATVERGDLIASTGTTGSSTGCHLHFEVWLGGKLTDPAPWL